jgi:hypothetical protein
MALTTNRNYLQPTGFKFIVNRQNYPNLEYFAQSLVHPGASVSPVELPTSRVTRVPLAGDKINYGEMSVDIILDEDMTSYKEMQNWLERIVNDGHITEDRNGKIATASDITVIILNSHNNNAVTIKYQDCVPTSIGQLTLASNVQDVAYTTFNVSFRFSQFVIT